MRPIVDTHAHICDPVFDEDRSDVLERARDAGITAVIAVGENLSDARKNIDLAAEHLVLQPAAGLREVGGAILFWGWRSVARGWAAALG